MTDQTTTSTIAYLRRLADQMESGRVRPMELTVSRPPEEVPTSGVLREFRAGKTGTIVLDIEWLR